MAVQTLKNIRGYEIREQIGKGGFGAVYRAYQAIVDREVAVKVILPQYVNHPEFVRNFEIEARLIARLEHPFIVPLFDFWREPDGAYLVMRYLHGGSWKSLIKNGEAVPLERVGQMLAQVAGALDNAHRAHVIHRDIKPENILLDDEGNSYLADFGIAHKLDSFDPSEVGKFRGTLAYLAPEIIHSAEVSAASDIYSLGYTVHEMITGKHALTGQSPNGMMAWHLERRLPAIPDAPEGVNLVLQQATAKDPEARYPSTQKMAAAFLEAIHLSAPVHIDTKEITVNPYKGLRAFDETDAQDFFGRDDVIHQILERFEDRTTQRNFLAVVGPSGSGKSSVVNAGVVPAIRNGHLTQSEEWFIVTMTPTSQPLQQLKTALLSVAIDPSDTLTTLLSSSDNGLNTALDEVLEIKSPLLLVIDQFEEVFTLVDDETERRHFLDLLCNAVCAPDSKLKLLITLRADFYDKPLLYENFGTLVQQRTFVVLPLKTEELQQAITGPAKRVGLEFDVDLVATIVAEVRQEPGALPLLQYALTELFEQRDGKQLHLAAYQKSGGVSGALARRAEEVYKTLSDEQQTVAKQIFLRLVNPGEGTEDTRRRALYSELGQRQTIQPVLDAFGKYRLLTFDNDPETREPTIEVAHEALIREWRRLRGWLNDNRSDIRLQRVLVTAMQDWRSAHCDPSYLVRGTRLAQFEEWVKTSHLALSGEERQFLEASIHEKEREALAEKERQTRELALERRSRWRLQMIVAILLLASAAGIFLTVRVYNESRNADRRAQEADSLKLAAQALNDYNNGDTVDALAKAMGSVALDNPPSEALATLIDLAYAPGLRALIETGDQAVAAVAISPDGRWVLSASGTSEQNSPQPNRQPPAEGQGGQRPPPNGQGGQPPNGQGQPPAPVATPEQTPSAVYTLTLWDSQTGEQAALLQEQVSAYSDVFFLTDGRAVSASLDGVVTVWDIEKREAAAEITLPPAEKMTLSSSDKGVILITNGGSNHRMQLLWDVEAGEEIARYPGETGLWTGRISADGTLAASAYLDGTIRLWNPANGEEIRRFNMNVSDIKHASYSLQISPDNRMIAVTVGDHQIGLWDTLSGEILNHLPSGTVITHRALFGGEDHILSVSKDGILRVWDLTSGVVHVEMKDRGATFESAALSADGRFAVTGSIDGALRFWDIEETLIRQVQHFDGHPVKRAVFLPSGEQLLTFGAMGEGGKIIGKLVLWEVATGKPAYVSEIQLPFMIHSFAVSADGERALVGMITQGPGVQARPGANNVLLLWDVQTGEQIREIDLGAAVNVLDIAFNPINRDEALITYRDTIQLRHLESGDVLREYKGHERAIKSITFHADGKTFVSTSDDGTLRLWDFETGEMLRVIEHGGRSEFAEISPDGTQIAVANGSDIVLWNLTTGEKGHTLTGHSDIILGFNFSDDGQRAVSGSWDNTFIVWDVKTGQMIRRYTEHNAATWEVAFSPDQNAILSVAEGAGMILWRADPVTREEVTAWIQANRYIRGG